MIIQGQVELKGKAFLHTYSDINMKIRQVETNIVYDDAWDIIPCEFTYKETDEPIEPIEEPIV